MTFNPHTVWCSHRNIEEGLHDEQMACCYQGVGDGVAVVPQLGYDKTNLWVYATQTAHPDALAAGVIPGSDAFDGIAMVLEQRVSGSEADWEEQPALHLTSSEARTLAAALIRAADIQQGLTR